MNTDKLHHVRLDTLRTRENQLLINDVPVSTLVEIVGRTPFYAYDRQAITERIRTVRQALPPAISLHYAIKANPMPALVGHMRPLVDGFDVASHGEMLTALDSGMPAEFISFAGPAKQEQELRAAIAAGVCINCESETELERIARHATHLGTPAQVALRVNPAFELKGSGMKMSGSPKQFGIDEERVPRAITRLHELQLHFAGLHIFCGSQNLNADSIIEANRLSFALAARLIDGARQPPRYINIGGGYGVPYFPGEQNLDLAAVGAALAKHLEAHADALMGAEIVLELGRFLVGEAGYYIARVSDIKESQGHTFVMVDGGLHHHLANSGNFGQVLRKNYPVLIANKATQPATQIASIVGPLCTPLDIVADRLRMPSVAIGDLVAVLQSGAYGYTASPHRFLGHPPPLELLV